jgi:hypothetical protein
MATSNLLAVGWLLALPGAIANSIQLVERVLARRQRIRGIEQAIPIRKKFPRIFVALTVLMLVGIAFSLGSWLARRVQSRQTPGPSPPPVQAVPPEAAPKITLSPKPTTRASTPRSLRRQPPTNTPAVIQKGTDNDQTVIQGGAVLQQNSTGDCSPNIIGSGNTNTCNEQPKVLASKQQLKASGNPAMPWVVEFTISTSALTQTGDLQLKCSGPALLAAISRINPMEFISGSNGPLKDDPTTVVYELGPEMLSPGKLVSIAVYSRAPVSVLSGTIGPNRIIF